MARSSRRSAWRLAAGNVILSASFGLIASEALAGGNSKAKVASNDREADQGEYNGAFSDPVQAGQVGAQGATGSEADTILNALTQQGSFPLRLHLGDEPDKGWPEDSAVDKAPAPVARRYKIGACEFVLRTGEFGIRQYRPAEGKAKGQFEVAADALQRNTTIPVAPKETLYLSATTELVAAADPAAKTACAKAFKGKRVALGKASLGRSALEIIGVDQHRLGWDTVTMAGSIQIYLTWDESRGELSVEEASGLPPSLESGIFAVAPTAAGDYAVALAPAMDLSKK